LLGGSTSAAADTTTGVATISGATLTGLGSSNLRVTGPTGAFVLLDAIQVVPAP
jgi:hypothetical protein